MKNFLPILIALLAQLIVLVILLALIQGLWHGFQLIFALWPKLLFQMLGAVLLSYLFKLPRWWFLIQLILPIAVVFALSLPAPTWIYPLTFFLLLFFFWNSAHERVPLYLTNKTTNLALGDLLEKEKVPINFIDLGCGLAGSLNVLAGRFPQHSFTGIETAPFPYILSKIRCALSGHKNVVILRKNIWDADLSPYQYAYAFLSPEPMPRLFDKVTNEMKHGATFISNSFDVLNSPAPRILDLMDKRQTKLHIWNI